MSIKLKTIINGFVLVLLLFEASCVGPAPTPQETAMETPDQVGKTRGTLWEIHPVMQIEVEKNGQWVTLDSLASQ